MDCAFPQDRWDIFLLPPRKRGFQFLMRFTVYGRTTNQLIGSVIHELLVCSQLIAFMPFFQTRGTL